MPKKGNGLRWLDDLSALRLEPRCVYLMLNSDKPLSKIKQTKDSDQFNLTVQFHSISIMA
tara:strand:- start:4394 stop:4573 length:180 start_codon:yes stop_codon:yes gene_type:complete